MALYREYSRAVDLANPLHVLTGYVLVAGDDKAADRFTLTVTDDGTAVALSAYTVTGYFTRSDGTTVAISGTVDTTTTNKCYITLPQACYAEGGAFALQIKATDSAGALTLAEFRGAVTPAAAQLVDGGVSYPSATQLTALLAAKIDKPATEGSNGYVLTADGSGGVSWEDTSVPVVAGTVQVDGTAYILQTGSAGAAGYLTFVLEA